MKGLAKIAMFMVMAGSLVTSGFAEVVDRVVAVVNHKVITQYQVQQAEKTLFPETTVSQDSPEARREKVLNFLIENELIRQKAEADGIAATEEDLNAALADIKQRNKLDSDAQLKEALGQEGKTWQEFLAEIRTQIKMAKLTNREVRAKIEIAEDEVKAYYQAHTNLFKQAPAAVHVRQILLKVKEGATEAEIQSVQARAAELIQKLRAGADFTAIAKEFSEHSSGPTGGELGTFKQGELAAPFDMAFTMNAGDISDPVRSAQGFYIISVPEKFSGEQVTYETAIPQIRNKLLEEKSTELYKKWIAALKEKAYVAIQ